MSTPGADSTLGHPLPPGHVGNRRYGTEMPELDALDGRREVGLDRLPGRGLASTAGAGEEKQHDSILTGAAR
jgi:hypothetical protein